MKEQDLKKTLSEIHVKSDIQQELIETCKSFDENKGSHIKKVRMKSSARMAVIAASLAVVVLTTTVYGEAIYHKVQEVFLGDHSLFISVVPTSGDDIETISEITSNNVTESTSVSVNSYSTLEEAEQQLAFKLNLSDYLLENYELDYVDLYTFGDEQSIGIYFKKDNELLHLLALPAASEAHTAFDGDEDITTIDVQGNDGIISALTLSFNLDGVEYIFSPTSADGKDSRGELEKIADSYN